MRAKNFSSTGMICLSAALGLAGCGKRQAPVPEEIQIGVTYYDQSDTFLEELLACFREKMDRYAEDGLAVTMTVRDAAGSQRTQDDQVEELLREGCNVLCVNLVDRADPSEIIDLAREKDVPIVFFNREPVAEDLMQWDKMYYVGAYAAQSGEMQGELAIEAIRAESRIDRNHDGKIQYVVLEGEPGHQDAIIRTESAVDTLKNSGIELEKLSWQIANWNRAQAQNRMTQMIGQYQTAIELVLANNDDMALGAVDAYEAKDFTESTLPLVLGIDGTEVGLEAVAEGRLWGTVYNDKEGQAEAMARLVAALVTGEGMEEVSFENERYIYLPYAKITKEHVHNYHGSPHTY